MTSIPSFKEGGTLVGGKMELKDMVPVILIIVTVGLVIGVGVLVLDQMGIAVKSQDVQITDESLTISSSAGTTTNDDISISSVVVENRTDGVTYIDGNATAGEDFNITTGGIITTTLLADDDVYNISYTYDADSASTTAVFSTRDAVDDFVTWLPVIVIILAAAIILGLVMRSFNK